MSWIDHIKDHIVESDAPAAKPKVVNAPGAALSGATTYHSFPEVDAAPVLRAETTSQALPQGNAYKKLKDKTDFDNTDVGRSLKKYLDPLASLALDEHTKMKAAVAQAQTQDNLTADRILSTLDGLKDTLVSEQGHFRDAMAQATAKEIDQRKQAIDGTQKQIEQLQQTLIQLTTELAQQKAKLDRAQSDFDSAFATRNAELDQQKMHFAELLR